MGQHPFSSFENDLQKSAEQLEIKPSAKVWQSVESNLNSNALGGATGISSIAKSLLSNWILNIAVPAVVLVGGGSIFYANYHHTNNVEGATNTNEVNSSVASTPKNTISDAATTVLNNKVANAKETSNETIINNNTNTIVNNESNTNATNYSLAIGSKNAATKSNAASILLTANKSAASTDSDQFSSTSGSVFTPSDIDKIAKKETEKVGKIEYKERNNKSVDFTE